MKRGSKRGMLSALLLAALISGLCTTSCTEEELGADATTNPLAGTLHLGAVMLDGAVISPSTGANTRMVTEGDVKHGPNRTSPNLVITGFEAGDKLGMTYYFTDGLYSGTTVLTFNESNGWTTTDAIKPAPEKDETWAKASITLNYISSNIELVSNFEGPLGIPNNVSGVRRYPDDLIADTPAKTANDLQPGQYHIDTQVGSSTLGRITARLAHRRALLRLPADDARLSITGYPEQFSHLHELLAKVEHDRLSDYCRFTPVIVGNEQYWQAIVPATDPANPSITYKLTEFIALIGPAPSADYPFGSTEDGTPGNHTFPTSDYTASDNNLKTTKGTLLKPITIPLSEEVTMTRNTRYPLTLSLSPYTATVSFPQGQNGAPGWSTDGDDQSGIQQEPDLVPVTDPDGQTVYIIKTHKGLRQFVDIVNGYGPYSPKPATNGRLATDIDLLADGYFIGDENTWNSISNYEGTFDGDGHTISNLKNGQGIFNNIKEGGTVKDLIVAKGEKYDQITDGGTIAGTNEGTIINCHNLGIQVKRNQKNGTVILGGIVGTNSSSGIIVGCTNAGEVSGQNKTNYTCGGIAGMNYGSIIACVNTAGAGGDEHKAGCITGENSGTITACINIGSSGGSTHMKAGITGQNNNTITACISTDPAVNYNSQRDKDSKGIAALNYGSILHVFWQRNEETLFPAVSVDKGANQYTYHSAEANQHFTVIGPLAATDPATRTSAPSWVDACDGTFDSGDLQGSNGESLTGALSLNAAISQWNKENGNKCPYKFVLNTKKYADVDGALPNFAHLRRGHAEMQEEEFNKRFGPFTASIPATAADDDLSNPNADFLGKLPLRLVPDNTVTPPQQ